MAYISRNTQQCVQRELKYIMGMRYAGDGLKNVFHNILGDITKCVFVTRDACQRRKETVLRTLALC
jgi:hypothetical protein